MTLPLPQPGMTEAGTEDPVHQGDKGHRDDVWCQRDEAGLEN